MRNQFLVCLIAVVAVSTSASADLTPEKQVLIRKLVEVSGGEQIAGQVSQIVLNQVLREYSVMAEAAIAERTDFTPVQKEALRMRLSSSDAFLKKFNDRFPKRVTFDEVLTSVYYPLYDRFFTTDEMMAIVAFYESPTGVKAIEVMPSLMQDAIQSSMELIAPRAIDLSKEILEEELAEFNQ